MPLGAFCLSHFLADFIICICVFDFRQAREAFDEVLDRLLEAKRRLSRDMPAPPTSESDIENLFGGAVRKH
jgi:hypothetical protein